MAVVTPSLTDTFRVSFRAGLKSLIDAYKAAHPYDGSTGLGLAETYDYPPESYHTPCAYVEKSIPETVRHDVSTRFRVLTGRVVLVAKLISNAQATHEQDVLVDALHEWFTINARVAGNGSVLEVTAVDPDVELTDKAGTHYSATIFTVRGNRPLGRQ